MKSEADVLPFPVHPKPVPTVVLWTARGRPDERKLRGLLAEAGYHQAERWSSEPDQTHPPHAHVYPELLWLLTGSVVVILAAERRLLQLGPGDRVLMPAGVLHAVLAGPDGASYLVATRLADGDRLDEEPRS
jgi:quercetin dioxygenase-like cupin family protein